MARLVNISSHGALILADNVPTLHQPIEVWIENAQETGWIMAEAVRFGRSKEVGIRFYHPSHANLPSMAARGTDSPRVAASDEVTPCLDEVMSGDPSLPEYL